MTIRSCSEQPFDRSGRRHVCPDETAQIVGSVGGPSRWVCNCPGGPFHMGHAGKPLKPLPERLPRVAPPHKPPAAIFPLQWVRK